MRISISFAICFLASLCSALDTSYLLNNRFTHYVSNFQTSLEEGLGQVYNGFNLIFKFDKEAYEKFVRFQSPEEKFYEEVYAEGFEDASEWYQYHNEKLRQQERRDLQSEGQQYIIPFEEEYHSTVVPKSVGVKIHQYQYYCNGTRVSFANYLEFRNHNKFKCENKPRKVVFDACYNDYEKYPKNKVKGCTGFHRLKCSFDVLKPATDCYTPEEMNEFGLGEVCKVLDDNEKQTFEFTMNCTHGINTISQVYTSTYFETVYDMELKDGSEFWLKDTDRFIYFPFDPKFKIEIAFQNFKYLSQFQKFFVNITDPDQIIGKKPITVDLDFKKMDKTYSPGGRYFYKIWLRTEAHSYFTLEDNSGLMAIKGYQEPKKSKLDYYLKIFTLKRIILLILLISGISLCIFCKRRREQNEKRLLEQAS
ncbi:unnamed protein product [Moneuplotes crassus]|uniref:Uncharacterized protein n=1 Tax=Euplotes crassus TaxID=5936 RepID=A0AAD1XFR5_EUPCR|nr:unnamed protein product [Moneuplotes crassus]